MQQSAGQVQKAPGARTHPAHTVHRQPVHQRVVRLLENVGERRPRSEGRLRRQLQLSGTEGGDGGTVPHRAVARAPGGAVGRSRVAGVDTATAGRRYFDIGTHA